MSSYLLGERSMRFDRTEDFTRRDYPDETMTTHVNYLGADNDGLSDINCHQVHFLLLQYHTRSLMISLCNRHHCSRLTFSR